MDKDGGGSDFFKPTCLKYKITLTGNRRKQKMKMRELETIFFTGVRVTLQNL